MTTLICKIPPNLPLPKGGITPLWQRGARGDLPMLVSIQNSKTFINLIKVKYSHLKWSILVENPRNKIWGRRWWELIECPLGQTFTLLRGKPRSWGPWMNAWKAPYEACWGATPAYSNASLPQAGTSAWGSTFGMHNVWSSKCHGLCNYAFRLHNYTKMLINMLG